VIGVGAVEGVDGAIGDDPPAPGATAVIEVFTMPLLSSGAYETIGPTVSHL
jgi:hypothetical protein